MITLDCYQDSGNEPNCPECEKHPNGGRNGYNCMLRDCLSEFKGSRKCRDCGYETHDYEINNLGRG